ncbi:MAG: beta-propeller fold lactonase family protein [Verrucomicrobiota bacterium]
MALTSLRIAEIVTALMFNSRSSLLLVTSLLFAVVVAGCKSSATASTTGPSRGHLLVCNKGDHALGIIDVEAGKQIAAVDEEGVTGHEVVASPDGKRAFVPIFGNSGVGKPGTDGSVIRVIDLAERKIVGTVDFGRGVRPHCAVIGPKDGLLYVTTELENAVTVIDPVTLKIVATIPTGQAESHMFAIAQDGKRGYTSNVGSGTVSVLDLAQRKVLTTIAVAPVAQRLSLSVDDRWLFTSDQTKPRLAVIDTKTDAVGRWIEMPSIGYGTAPTPDGKWLIVALPKVNKIGVVDLQTMTVAHTLDVPAAPQEVLVRPDGAEAYISCDASGKIAVVDVRSWIVTKLIDAGRGADGLGWAVGK